jgi:RNA-directed DNA polymerase
MQRRYGEIRIYLQGWMNYFGIALKYNDAIEMDHWLRRRIRMYYWKQWRRARRRIGEMIKLGSARCQTILMGLSRKSYWHPVAGLRAGSLRLAKTLSTNIGLSNAFLEQQGLVSIRTLWIEIHYPAKARRFLRTA